jgi:hypothetical protein
MGGHGNFTYMMSKLSTWRFKEAEEMQDNLRKLRATNKTLPN